MNLFLCFLLHFPPVWEAKLIGWMRLEIGIYPRAGIMEEDGGIFVMGWCCYLKRSRPSPTPLLPCCGSTSRFASDMISPPFASPSPHLRILSLNDHRDPRPSILPFPPDILRSRVPCFQPSLVSALDVRASCFWLADLLFIPCFHSPVSALHFGNMNLSSCTLFSLRFPAFNAISYYLLPIIIFFSATRIAIPRYKHFRHLLLSCCVCVEA